MFKTENNVTRLFHQHAKVATRALPNLGPKALKSAIKAPRETKQKDKLKAKQARFGHL